MNAAAGPTTSVDVARVIDDARLNFHSLMIVVLCGLCLVIDGFDVQAMGYVAPAIIRDWSIAKASLGPVFGAGLFGMLVGSLVLSIAADRYGRRPVLLGATFFFGLCMLVTPLASNVEMLVAIRFVTGLALGCIMPNAMALAGEFSSSRGRITRMMLVSCGFTVGAALGGLVSAFIIPRWGWQGVFSLGGVTPLVLLAFMLRWLPESMQFLLLKHGNGPRREQVLAQVRRTLDRVAPGRVAGHATDFHVQEHVTSTGGAKALMQQGRAGVTLLLWGISFMNLINLYFLSNWLPTLLHDEGYNEQTAVLIGSTLQIGGVAGTLLLGRMIERWGFVPVLSLCFLLACGTVAALGHAASMLSLLLVLVAIAGFCIVGGQPALNTLAGTFYPTSLRATGIGWCLGIGRIGSVVGPVVGGQLVAWHWSNVQLFHAAALPVLCSFLMFVALGRMRRTLTPSLQSA